MVQEATLPLRVRSLAFAHPVELVPRVELVQRDKELCEGIGVLVDIARSMDLGLPGALFSKIHTRAVLVVPFVVAGSALPPVGGAGLPVKPVVGCDLEPCLIGRKVHEIPVRVVFVPLPVAQISPIHLRAELVGPIIIADLRVIVLVDHRVIVLVDHRVIDLESGCQSGNKSE